ncbi:MAG: type II toxin-antitoxin system VapC family toxin [Thermacetogeniaceae bacterium]
MKKKAKTADQAVERYTLDTYAVLSYLRDEPCADEVASLLEAGKSGRALLYLSWINLGEVYYIVQRRTGHDTARCIVEMIKEWPLQLVLPSQEDILNAADVKAKYPLSYADAFAAALARSKQACLVTGNMEFKRLEEDGMIKIRWLQNRR